MLFSFKAEQEVCTDNSDEEVTVNPEDSEEHGTVAEASSAFSSTQNCEMGEGELEPCHRELERFFVGGGGGACWHPYQQA